MENNMDIKLYTPFTDDDISALRAGDTVRITGYIYTGRDAAHKRLVELLEKGESLPIDIMGGAIYYVGPAPARPGRVIGSAGPTSSYRMDPYTEPLLKEGLKVMIGKGPRGDELRALLPKYNAVYLSAIGGAAALISESVKSSELVLYEDLGAEAVYKLYVEDMFAVVTYDAHGGDLFTEGTEKYRK